MELKFNPDIFRVSFTGLRNVERRKRGEGQRTVKEKKKAESQSKHVTRKVPLPVSFQLGYRVIALYIQSFRELI